MTKKEEKYNKKISSMFIIFCMFHAHFGQCQGNFLSVLDHLIVKTFKLIFFWAQ